jgi:glycosyltransferase involved in cell wall biosynthesis
MFKYFGRMVAASVKVIRSRGDWDVIVSNSHYPFDLLPVLFGDRSSTSFVTYWHHHVQTKAGRPRWVYRLTRLSEFWAIAALKVRFVVVHTVNSGTRNFLLSSGIPASQVHLTRNASSISLTSACVLPDMTDEDEGKGNVLFCGRLSRLKGTRDLALLAAQLVRDLEHIGVVVIGGDGDDGVEVRERLSSEISAGRVVFTGFIREDEKIRLFKSARVVIMPSYEEGWSMTVGDGLQENCWVVAYDLPAVREAFPVGPIYVPVGDWEEMLAKVKDCLEMPRPDYSSKGSSWTSIADDDMSFIQRFAVERKL